MTLDLAGHTMTCTGSGFAGTCQAATFGTAAGITVVPGLAGVRVRGPGLLTCFDDGVEIVGSHARVKGLTITGAACGPDECSRPVSQGTIVVRRVVDGVPQSAPVDVSLVSNSISGFARGIGLLGLQCPGAGSECVLNGNRVEGSSGERICNRHQPRGDHRLHADPKRCPRQRIAAAMLSTDRDPLNAGSTGNTVTNNDSSHNHGLWDQHGSGHKRQYVREQHSTGERGHRPAGLPWDDESVEPQQPVGTEGGAVPALICNPGE